jgi:hypothetical protein
MSGVATALAMASFITWAVVTAGNTQHWAGWSPGAPMLTRTVTVSQPFTSLSVESYGAPIRVTGGAVTQATVTEGISYDRNPDGPYAVNAGGPPAVTAQVSNGRLTLAAPSCASGNNCAVAFTVSVPAGTAVTATGDGGAVSVTDTGGADLDSGGGTVDATAIAGPLTVNAEGGNVTVTSARSANLDSGGGSVSVSGIAGQLTVSAGGGGVTASHAATASLDSGGGPVTVSEITGPLKVNAEGGGVTVSHTATANLNSGGGPVTANAIGGPLTVSTEGGQLQLAGLTGAFNADTGGGQLAAQDVAASTATAQTDGGPAALTFATPPNMVQVTSGGGNITLQVPGGPYSVSATTDDGQETVTVPTSPAANRIITVDSGGGALFIEPAGSSG